VSLLGLLSLITLYFFFFYICFSFYPPAWPDEVLFFSPSQNFSLYKTLNTSVLSGLIEGMDRETLWMPPLFFLYSSLWIQLLGLNLFAIRMGSLFASILALFPILGIAKKMGMGEKSKLFLTALVLTDILFYKISSTARMESLCLLFSLTGLYFLFLEENTFWGYTLSGLFLGLGVICHPFGIVFTFPALSILYFRSSLKFSHLLWIGIGGLLPLVGWGLYILPNLDLFLIQFVAQLGRKKDLLISVFTLTTKIKIILSGFKYPIFKILNLFFLMLLLLSLLKFNKLKSEFKINIYIHSVSLFTIMGFLFLSSESWYVYYIIPFLSFLASLIFEYGNKTQRNLVTLLLVYNIFIIGTFININFFENDTKSLQETYFKEIYNLSRNSKKIYLQAIPDPFFYLSDKKENFDLREFIPGELPLSVDYPKKEMSIQDVYIFYNEDLMHPFLREFLRTNIDKFERFEINIPTPREYEFKFFAVVYRKK
jgi:hypothetical protein